MGIDLLVGLLSSLIFASLGFGVGRIKRSAALRLPTRNLWRLQDQAGLTFVLTRAQEHDEREHTDFTYPAEARAVGELESFLLRSYPKNHVRVVLSPRISNPQDHISSELLRQDLVVVGGPNHNKVSRQILEKCAGLAHFEEYELVLKHGAWRDQARIDDAGNITSDVGLVLMGPNPWNPARRVVLLAGSRTYGCLAAARSMVRSDAPRTNKMVPRHQGYVAFAVRAEVVGEDVVNVQVVAESLTLST